MFFKEMIGHFCQNRLFVPGRKYLVRCWREKRVRMGKAVYEFKNVGNAAFVGCFKWKVLLPRMARISQMGNQAFLIRGIREIRG